MLPSSLAAQSVYRVAENRQLLHRPHEKSANGLEEAGRDGHRKAMSDKNDKSDKSWSGKAALAGAAIGSAAIAAALLYASRRKERAEKKQPSPEDAPETD
ncbi:hypothetical protein GCM10023306_30070 [Novosphingobium ginsenosidimutans]